MASFKLVTGDLIRLVETPHEKQQEVLTNIGGLQGVAAALNVDPRQGLNSNNTADLALREESFGRNYVEPPKPKSFLELMWDAYQDITIIVLTISGFISIVLSVTVGDHPETGWVEGACIILAVIVVTIVTAMNDYQKEAQFRALNAVKEDEKIKVIRNGQPAEVSKWSLVVGDIVRVDLGDIIPADGIVFDEKEIKMDESAMTGESDLLSKNAENPFLLSGTKVMEGVGKMLVVCVGEHSQAGIIKSLINGNRPGAAAGGSDGKTAAENNKMNAADDQIYVEIETPKDAGVVDEEPSKAGSDEEESQSPLEGKLYNLTVLIGKLGTLVALLVFVIMSIRFSIDTFGNDNKPWKSGYISDYLNFFIIAITVLVVAIPEGLPLAVTIALAYSVKKMLVDNNLVRHLDACETMGSATTVCSDKTGTLTTNRMTVMQLWIGDKEFSSASSGIGALAESTKEALCTGIAVNSTAEILPPKVENGLPEHTGNKTECALLQFIRDGGVEYPELRANNEVVHMLTFSSAKKRMSVVVRRSATTCRVYTKGATEVVLGLCENMQGVDGSFEALDDARKAKIGAEVIEKYASQAYRTLCLAYRDLDVPAEETNNWSDEDLEKNLTCLAIVGIEDPVRPEVPGAIQKCNRAGITVRMVTGDNITTARSIASKCGITKPGDGSLIMDGQTFRNRVLDAQGNIIQSEFDKIWPMLRVLARSSPKDKYTLVSGLMQSNVVPHGPQVVAVTGDGTNDAPALKKANVGFAMGISGTAVAKDASDIILMDDNFNSIVNAIKWGRNVYDSIAKFLQFQLTVNVVAISLAFIGAVVLEQSPLSAVQMLWVNLIMDSFASLALATEEPTPALLERKPYPKTQPLISKKMTKHIIGQSIYQLILLLVIVFTGEKWFDISSGRYTDLPEDVQDDPTVHMTIVFNTFVWAQLFNELNCRKIHDEINIFTGITKNRVFLYVCVLQVAMQYVMVQHTGDWFKCKPLSVGQWFACIAMGFVSMPLGLVLRSISMKNAPSWMAICREVDETEVRNMTSGRGQELWVRGFARIRAQIRVVKAFKKGLQSKALVKG
ncbi:Plasma membrane calcium-transporting ATPase 4 [Phytophthora fragariae]|uniref:Calcium-transporting ATPase n=1 Tax=Phytophthora fragariae TaxID=53985 RepID=A0A6A3TUS1_9STRA|nr:Plasma membrane calcium-transporting ATPase 4 [Phytophthora fragariae]KAE8950056.1 Plasma membrane calcium-transporting ATPase 4 [Phytophthora fragariae]KAE9031247.1 Plasma membrane calcium-transporting ATPase 4 [Phytophthora fragariae]KAE9140363.1 Plasma membrane calcium-transporting ATPase 4 [Phytophthora fragariae]KAE9141078.1 Plasma membrane calcium-transporting ATPase 4 [Phytophthora fragariae]